MRVSSQVYFSVPLPHLPTGGRRLLEPGRGEESLAYHREESCLPAGNIHIRLLLERKINPNL